MTEKVDGNFVSRYVVNNSGQSRVSETTINLNKTELSKKTEQKKDAND